MSHLIAGVDLGEREIRIAVLETGFRKMRFLDVFVEPVEDGDAPLLERQKVALRQGLQRVRGEKTVYLGMPGERLTLRVLDLPFSDPKKVAQVIGFELESSMVHELDDVVFDYRVTKNGTGGTALAAAAKSDDVGGILKMADEVGVDPRTLFATPLVYGGVAERFLGDIPAPAVVERMSADRSASVRIASANAEDVQEASKTIGTAPSVEVGGLVEPGESIGDIAEVLTESDGAIDGAVADKTDVVRVLLDVGLDRTNIVFFRGSDILLARTLTRGISPLRTLEEPDDPHALLPAEQVRRAMKAWLRELRQTMAAFDAQYHVTPETTVLIGGAEFEDELVELIEESLPAVYISSPETWDFPMSPELVIPDHGLMAMAIAWAGGSGRKQIDLRQGAFVYRARLSVVRQKAVHLTVLAVAVLAAFGLTQPWHCSGCRGKQKAYQRVET